MPIESIHDGCSYINDNTVQLRSVLHVSLQPKYHKTRAIDSSLYAALLNV